MPFISLKTWNGLTHSTTFGTYHARLENFPKGGKPALPRPIAHPQTETREIFKLKVFKTPLPANGKKCFKELAIDTSHHEGNVHGESEDYNLLEKEGKFLAVRASAKFNGKKDDGIGCSKTLKVKMKIKLVDRDKVAE